MIRAKFNRKQIRDHFGNLNKFFNNLSNNAFMETKKSAERYIGNVQSGIGATSAPSFVEKGWKPLSGAWKNMKTAHAEEFWIETGGIRANTKVEVENSSRKLKVIFAGIKASYNIAAFSRAHHNEYGSAFSPPRPLFHPAADIFSTKITAGSRKLKKQSEEYKVFYYKILQTALKALR